MTIASDTATGADWQQFGRFENDGRTFAVTDPQPPLPWDNYLFNDRYLSVVDHFGRGWSKLHTREGHVTFLWHLSAMYERDDNRLVYLRDDETGEFWSVSTYPAGGGAEEFACRHTLGATEISSRRDGVAGSLRILVPPGADPAELWTVRVANDSGRPRRISVFSYGAVSLKGALTHGYIHFCQGTYRPDAELLYFQNNAPNLPHERYRAFQACSRRPDSWSASRNAFRGLYGRLDAPASVVEGQCPNAPASREPLAACMHHRLEVAAGEAVELHYLAGIVASVDEAGALIGRYLDGDGPARVASAVSAEADQRLASPQLTTPEASIDRLIGVWTKQQVALGAGWGRWGWRGYRDIIQQTHGATYFDLPRVRANLVEAMTWQMRDGFSVRGWAPLSPKRYADSSLWLCYTANDYVKETADTDFLHQLLPYRDGGIGPVWQHLLRGCEKVFTDVGPHGLPRIHQGDWNDSLSAVGEKGRGESVWLAEALCWSLLELIELFQAAGLDEQADTAGRWHAEMAGRVNEHAWDGGWYVRGFTDDGAPLGGAACTEGRIYLNAQTWAVLGEIAPPDRRDAMMAAVEEHLRVPYGYLTLAPAYTTYDPTIGRITGMPPGTGENAAVYVHANAFAYACMLKLGRPDRALELLRTIHPCNGVNPTSNSGSPPYILPNSYYGPGYVKPGRIEGTWVTGSAGWYMHQTIEHLCGLHRTHEGLRLQPQLPGEWDKVTVHRRFRGETYDVTVRRDPSARTLTVACDGDTLAEPLLPLTGEGAAHEVTVLVP